MSRLVNDTSRTPALAPTYMIMPMASLINEGQALTTMVHATGVANGTTLYWSLGGTNIDAADFSAGALTGSSRIITDVNGMGMLHLSHTIANDLSHRLCINIWQLVGLVVAARVEQTPVSIDPCPMQLCA